MHNKKKLFALMLAACLLVSILPLPAMAEGEAPVYYCGLHEHSDSCYRPLLLCELADHSHEDACYSDQYKERFCGQEADHTHEDSCLVKPQDTCSEEETCGAMQHTDSCLKGQADKAAAESAARIKSAQDLIDALPDTVTEETRTEVEAQLADIHAVQVTMTDGEREQLVLTRWENIQAALEALDGQKGAGDPDTIPEDAAAQIGENTYNTLQAAVTAAASGAEITLLKSITEEVTVAAGSNVDIDLSGYTVTGNFMVYGTAKIHNGTINNTNAAKSAVENNGAASVLVMEDVSITSARHAVRVDGGSATITGGTHVGNHHGFNISTAATVVIDVESVTGGVTAATGNAINVVGAGTDVTVNGGKLLGTHDPNYAQLAVMGGTVTVNNIECENVANDGNGTLIIKNGKVDKFAKPCNKNISVYGGTFTEDPSAFLAEGREAVLKNGKYVVENLPVAATIGTTEYYDLQEAFAAAKAANDGSVIVLQSDLALHNWTSVDMMGCEFALNGNGKTISGLDAPLITGVSHKAVTIENLNIVNANINKTVSAGGINATAALVAYTGRNSSLTISGVSVSGSTIQGSNYSGALVGYADDGPKNISNCSVTASTISGGSSTGAMIGHANGDTSVSGTVGGNTINSSGGSGWQGSVIGVLTSNNNNTLNVTETSRSASSSDLYVIGGLLKDTKYTGGSYYTDPTAEGDNKYDTGAGTAVPAAGYAFVQKSNGLYVLDELPQGSGDITDKKTSKSVSITWDDSSNARGIRPSQVTITLYANGVQAGDAITVTKQDGDTWNLEIKELDMYSAAKTRAPGTPTEIVYTVKQGDVSGYTTSYSADTLAITNKIKPKTAYVYSEHKLMQTGEELLSAGLMAFAGIFVLAAGMWLLRKKSYER